MSSYQKLNLRSSFFLLAQKCKWLLRSFDISPQVGPVFLLSTLRIRPDFLFSWLSSQVKVLFFDFRVVIAPKTCVCDSSRFWKSAFWLIRMWSHFERAKNPPQKLVQVKMRKLKKKLSFSALFVWKRLDRDADCADRIRPIDYLVNKASICELA